MTGQRRSTGIAAAVKGTQCLGDTIDSFLANIVLGFVVLEHTEHMCNEGIHTEVRRDYRQMLG